MLTTSPAIISAQEVQTAGGAKPPILFTLRQQSAEWRAWRMSHVGSSDVAAVMGVSDWQTAFGVWAIRTGRAPEISKNWAMRRGQRFEPFARRIYERETGLTMAPICAQHPEYEFMGVSLDGRNAHARRLLEVKVPKKEHHRAAKHGRVPEVYVPQCQYQLKVTGDERLDYMSYNGSTWHIVTVYPDAAIQAEITKAVCDFWNDYVLTDLPPGMADLDYKALRRSRDPVERAMFEYWSKARKMNECAESSLLAAYGVAS